MHSNLPAQCPQCGNFYKEDSIFCRKCGLKRGEQVADPESQIQVLEDIQELYLEKGSLYAKLESYWRSFNFRIALLLGILPVCVSKTELLPETYRQWTALLITLTNIVIVVFQLKLDIGEKIADASMAQKTFNTVASSIDVMLCQLRCSPGGVDVVTFLTHIKITMDSIQGQMKYPIAEKRFRAKTKGDSGCGVAYGVNRARDAIGQSLTQVVPEAG